MSTTDESGKARATIREIASAAGVSIATVSRVLNERPGVAAETRGAVLRVVRDHGFTANRSARALSGGRTGLIGVMLPIVAAPYFASILAGASEALYEQDMRMVMCPTLHHHEREVTLLDRLMHGTTDGAVLMLPEESNEELKQLRRKGYAFVIVDPRETLDEGIPAVSAANASGARAATEHLLSLGHRRIGAISGPARLPRQHRAPGRLRGAMAAAGVLPDPALVLESTFDIEGGAKAAARLLDAADPPTAIFAFNDNTAIGALRVARERGIRVPEDLSIVGFDDSELSAIVTPALTTVRQPLAEMGRMAVSLLFRILDGQRLEALHIELKTRLIVRDSTARVPEAESARPGSGPQRAAASDARHHASSGVDRDPLVGRRVGREAAEGLLELARAADRVAAPVLVGRDGDVHEALVEIALGGRGGAPELLEELVRVEARAGAHEREALGDARGVGHRPRVSSTADGAARS